MFGSMGSPAASAPANEVQAAVTFTPSAAGALTAASAALPAGAVGTPVRVEAFGSVGSYVSLTTTGQQQIIATVAPNGNPTTKAIPAQAFPGKVNSVQIGGYASGAGVVIALVTFRL